MTQPHRRRDKRVETPLLVFLENARGITRDTSPSGAYFWTSGEYSPGQPISFSIELNTAGGKMMWKCKGAVVRTEPRDYMVGVAATIIESTVEPVRQARLHL